MSNLNQRTTVYLNPYVKKFIQHKAITEGRSLSAVINEQFADMVEDLDDMKEIEKRRSEPAVPFEVALQELGLTYEQLRN